MKTLLPSQERLSEVKDFYDHFGPVKPLTEQEAIIEVAKHYGIKETYVTEQVADKGYIGAMEFIESRLPGIHRSITPSGSLHGETNLLQYDTDFDLETSNLENPFFDILLIIFRISENCFIKRLTS